VTGGWDAYRLAASREYQRSRERPENLYPHYSENGAWELLDVDALSSWQDGTYEHGNWTAGFWFGTMWLTALASGDEGPVELAKSRLPRLAGRAVDTTTHDLGFLFFPSVVLGYQCGFLGEDETASAEEAARTTARRFNDQGRYIQAFGPVADPRTAGTSTVDTLMNLPLLWWAAARTGDPRLFDVARHHARTSARLLVRPDGSTIHLMQLDPLSGAFLAESTLQGASPDSAWSRGSGWAICGLAWSYAVTREPELLNAAERAAGYYERVAVAGELPPWDFANATPDVPRDASAATAVALGYLILGGCHPDAGERRRYDQAGRDLLDVVSRLAINRDPDVDGILLHSCYSVPHGRGVDGTTGWGDFYAGLALAVAEGVLPLEKIMGTDVARREVEA
jgi:unsaturated chondroitin disaccharide hydrolase